MIITRGWTEAASVLVVDPDPPTELVYDDFVTIQDHEGHVHAAQYKISGFSESKRGQGSFLMWSGYVAASTKGRRTRDK